MLIFFANNVIKKVKKGFGIWSLGGNEAMSWLTADWAFFGVVSDKI